jgi:hypothetical protein
MINEIKFWKKDKCSWGVGVGGGEMEEGFKGRGYFQELLSAINKTSQRPASGVGLRLLWSCGNCGCYCFIVTLVIMIIIIITCLIVVIVVKLVWFLWLCGYYGCYGYDSFCVCWYYGYYS